jgi:chemotaxis protein methyltransferase CheR
MSLSTLDFDFVRRLVQERSSIVLDDSKGYLADARLDTLARQEGFGSPTELLDRLRAEAGDGLRRKVVEAMTTNETSFFRDIHPFDAIRATILPDLIARRAVEKRLTIWSAACSSGQEPYSLAMLLRTHFPSLESWQVTLVGKDLSGEMIDRARAGRYTQMEVNRGVPAAMLVRFFQRSGLDWHVCDELRRMVLFRRTNLVEAWPPMPRPDLVLLRNVLIYFDVETKRRLLERMSQALAPDGYLIVGGAENVMNAPEAFERVELPRCAAYQPRRPGRSNST